MIDANRLGLGIGSRGNPGKTVLVKNTSAADFSTLRDTYGFFQDDVNGDTLIFSSITSAVTACRNTLNDEIVIAEGYAETISAAAGVAIDKAGITIRGLGVGNARPRISFGSNTGASMDVTADNVAIKNVIGVAAIDGLTKPFNITGDGFDGDIEWQDASTTVEAATAVRLDTANNSRLRLKYNGYTGGNALVSAIRVDDCDNVEIYIDGYGVLTTAWVEFVDSASTNVSVRGRMYTSGITNFTRDVVDTIGGSTWDAQIYDASAGVSVEGGSGGALAASDSASLAASLATLQAEVSGAAGLASFPAGTAAANAVSLAEVLRYAQENIILGAGTALPSGTSLYGVLAGATGIPTFPAAAAPANDVSIAEVLREIYDQADKSITNTAATLVNGTTIFTIAGGSIEILALEAVCVTGNDATASTLQWSCDGTDGAATTFSAASASLANAAAGASVVLQGTSLATAPVVNASGAGIGQQVTNGIRIPAGIITTTIGVGSTTGTWQHRMRYRPLGRGVTVT